MRTAIPPQFTIDDLQTLLTHELTAPRPPTAAPSSTGTFPKTSDGRPRTYESQQVFEAPQAADTPQTFGSPQTDGWDTSW